MNPNKNKVINAILKTTGIIFLVGVILMAIINHFIGYKIGTEMIFLGPGTVSMIFLWLVGGLWLIDN